MIHKEPIWYWIELDIKVVGLSDTSNIKARISWGGPFNVDNSSHFYQLKKYRAANYSHKLCTWWLQYFA